MDAAAAIEQPSGLYLSTLTFTCLLLLATPLTALASAASRGWGRKAWTLSVEGRAFSGVGWVSFEERKR